MTTRPILLDVTRSLQRVARRLPVTGVDRVEITYIAEWLAAEPAALFVALGHRGWRQVARSAVRRLVTDPALPTAHRSYPATIDRLQRAPDGRPGLASGADLIAEAIHMLRDRAAPPADLAAIGPGVFLKASHDGLDRPHAYDGLAASGLRQILFVHDVQPLDCPEFFTPGEFERHRTRMQTVARHASRVLVNSQDTGDRFLAACRRFGWSEPPCSVLPLGIPPSLHAGTGHPAIPSPDGHFVMLGTVQPRKNHVLMLQLWRQLAEQSTGQPPKLVIIGRKGWLSEPVFRMMRRSPVLHESVVYAGSLDDATTWAVLRGARALLMPSHAEGYALPIAEALALGVPVIASDLPAHREVGGSHATYLDPLDGPGWLTAIIHAAKRPTPALPTAYQPPTWREHLRSLHLVVDEVASA